MWSLPRHPALLGLSLAGCVTRADELSSLDRDGDGWYHEAAAALGQDPPFDCDDADAAVHPEQADACNTADDDCDGTVDEDAPVWHPDADEDGFGDATQPTQSCDQPAGYLDDSSDCDDAAALVYPGATEVCDGSDNDCDGLVDLDDPDNAGLATWYADGDGDGFGDPAWTEEACEAPAGFAPTGGDCDDTLAAVNPGAAEDCESGLDEDCDGLDQTCGISGVRALSEASAHFTTGSFANVGAIGDFDGDGFDDCLITADRGHLYLGSATLLLGDVPSEAGAAEVSPMGWSVDPLGDLDGDGYGDFATGAMVFYGQAAPAGVIDVSTAGTTWTDTFGGITAGDFNADTFQDLLVPMDSGWKVVTGEGTRWPDTARAAAEPGMTITYGSAPLCSFAGSVGDVNGDGVDDILTGWPTGPCGDGEYSAGVGILHGGIIITGVALETDGDGLLTTEPSSGARLQQLEYLTDFDGDGYGDIAAVGSWATSVFYGTSTGLPSGDLATGDTEFTEAGVIAASDTDGDGVTELFMASEGVTIGFDGGTARGTYGPFDADTTIAGATVTTIAAGDFNGDRFEDLLIGSWSDGAWLLYGGP